VFHRFKTSPWPPLQVPSRLVVPVLSATGGGCRSTVSALLAYTFARVAPTLVLDASSPDLSPWSSWATPAPTTLAGLGHGAILTAAGLEGACSTQTVGALAWQVVCLPDPPAGLPGSAPQECRRLVQLGGWPVTVVDTGHSALKELSAGPDRLWSTTASWLEDVGSSPILSVPRTCQGLDYAHRFVTAALRQGLRCDRVTVAVVDVGQGPAPRSVSASSTVLAGRVGALFKIPYDRQIHADQMRRPARLTRCTIRAARALAASLADTTPVPQLVDSAPGTRPRSGFAAPSTDEWTRCDQR